MQHTWHESALICKTLLTPYVFRFSQVVSRINTGFIRKPLKLSLQSQGLKEVEVEEEAEEVTTSIEEISNSLSLR